MTWSLSSWEQHIFFLQYMDHYLINHLWNDPLGIHISQVQYWKHHTAADYSSPGMKKSYTWTVTYNNYWQGYDYFIAYVCKNYKSVISLETCNKAGLWQLMITFKHGMEISIFKIEKENQISNLPSDHFKLNIHWISFIISVISLVIFPTSHINITRATVNEIPLAA